MKKLKIDTFNQNISSYIRRSEKGEAFILSRKGREVSVLIGVEEFDGLLNELTYLKDEKEIKQS